MGLVLGIFIMRVTHYDVTTTPFLFLIFDLTIFCLEYSLDYIVSTVFYFDTYKAIPLYDKPGSHCPHQVDSIAGIGMDERLLHSL